MTISSIDLVLNPAFTALSISRLNKGGPFTNFKIQTESKSHNSYIDTVNAFCKCLITKVILESVFQPFL